MDRFDHLDAFAVGLLLGAVVGIITYAVLVS